MQSLQKTLKAKTFLLKIQEYFQKHFPDTWKAGREYRQEVSVFAETHFPFACNAAGYDFWIDTNTGQIKYIESIDFSMFEISIAPSFFDFYSNLQPKCKTQL